MNIEVGKFYKDGDGFKNEVFAIRDGIVLCAFQYLSGEWEGASAELHDAEQIWTPWIDEPAIPWDSVPEWFNWWAVDGNGTQVYYDTIPERGDREWCHGGELLVIPESHRIPYVGDWRESLRQRPGKEVV